MLFAALWLLGSLVVVDLAAAQVAREDKALGRPASASTVEDQRGGPCAFRICTPDKANDGRADTRWGSAFADGQYWQVDLGGSRLVDAVTVDWQTGYPARYRVSTSLDGVSFSVAEEGSLPGELERDHVVVQSAFAARSARYVRLTGVRRATQWGFSIWSGNVFGPEDTVSAPAPAPSSAPPVATSAPPAGPSAPPSAPAAPSSAAASPVLRRIAASTRVRLAGSVVGSKTSIRLLSVRSPRAATVRVRCTGPGCPWNVRRRRGSGRFRELRRVMGAGAVLEVFITQPNTYGKYTRFRIRRGDPPRRMDRCVAHGSRTPVACPAS
ncbi:MAG: discoidin domain-containing protein [Solirubrobacteraceae bacterium]